MELPPAPTRRRWARGGDTTAPMGDDDDAPIRQAKMLSLSTDGAANIGSYCCKGLPTMLPAVVGIVTEGKWPCYQRIATLVPMVPGDATEGGWALLQ
jgi:hypothetical protein